MSELETALLSPDAAVAEAARSDALARIDALAERLRRRIAAGLAPTAYRRCAALLDACEAARETVQAVGSGGRGR